jgi:TnpA family transposase
VQPSTIHADTQGQSAPVFFLATLFGFDLPSSARIRARTLREDRPPLRRGGRNAIDWRPIQLHWRDLMQVPLSISAGQPSSATLMRRLRSNSRKNRV